MEVFSNGWVWFAILVGAVILASLCYSLAEKKGYEEPSGYAVAGFFFGPIVLIYVAGLPDANSQKLLEKINKKLDILQGAMVNEESASAELKMAARDFSDLPPL